MQLPKRKDSRQAKVDAHTEALDISQRGTRLIYNELLNWTSDSDGSTDSLFRMAREAARKHGSFMRFEMEQIMGANIEDVQPKKHMRSIAFIWFLIGMTTASIGIAVQSWT